jgi:hypothetical protein
LVLQQRAVTLFQSIVDVADQQRPGYATSIGYTATGSFKPVDLPTILDSIFCYAVGTPHEITEQALMDFVPGHRLMLAAEIPRTRDQLDSFYGIDDLFNVQDRTPFLANYSSDYYLTASDDTGAFWLDHSGGTSLVSPNLGTFLETTLHCYQQGAYALDSDGFLELDDDLEHQIALSLNPGCEFWLD